MLLILLLTLTATCPSHTMSTYSLPHHKRPLNPHRSDLIVLVVVVVDVVVVVVVVVVLKCHVSR